MHKQSKFQIFSLVQIYNFIEKYGHFYFLFHIKQIIMLRNIIQKDRETKNKRMKSKSQDRIGVQPMSQISLTIFLAHDQQIIVPITINCPMRIINSLLSHKVGEFKKQEHIGFQSVSSNYSFDYRLSKSIGIFNEKRNITLNCLYKNSSLYELIKKQEQSQNKAVNIQHSSFYKINKYKICKPLSSGGFSRVYLVRNMLNGQFYAAKFMEKSSQVNVDRAQAIHNEFYVHKSLDHPFIVKMQEYIQTDQFYILIMQYCPGGQLFNLLKNNRYMGQEKAKTIFLQVLLAIKYLHDRNIVFRDIKPENILIDQRGNAKLTDFGLAKQIRAKTNSYCGSVEYMAPQIVSKQYYSLDVDLYCMGALLYQILIGCPPFYNPNFTNNQTKYHICNSEVSFPNKVDLSDEVKDLIGSLLVKDPNQRLGHFEGVQQILNHQWIGDVCLQTFLRKQVQCPFIPNLQIQNFDRQQDQHEKQFRHKIFSDMKQCKRVCTSIKVTNKFKFNPEIKDKSRSVWMSNKKHLKSKSQEQFYSTAYSKKINNSNIGLEQNTDKLNPYSFSITKKPSKSNFNSCSKNLHSLQINEKNQLFKKKSLHRTLSRSLNKSVFQPKKSVKAQIQNILLINGRSYSNSRKNSLQRKSSKHQNEDTRVSKVESTKGNNSSCFADLKNFTSQHKYHKSDLHKFYKSNKNVIMAGQKLKNDRKQQQVYIPKQSLQKQNFKGKGLKRKNLQNKKKFQFSSIVKDASIIKKNHFMFDKSLPNCQQNRKTVF